MTDLDPRIHPIRDDLAAAHYRDKIKAARYAEGRRAQVAQTAVPLRIAPDAAARRGSELLWGETVTIYDEKDGWCWVQNATDQYMGYVPAAALSAPGPEPTHRVAVLRTVRVPTSDIKSMPSEFLSFGTRLAVTDFVDGSSDVKLAKLADGSFVVAAHITPLTELTSDWPKDAERFLDAPYVWGGRTSLGIDCSGLVQMTLAGAGIKAPRDTDLQNAFFTNQVVRKDLRRGDLIFWRGHVGLMLDHDRLLHATAFGMHTMIEPLAEAETRIMTKHKLEASYRRP